MLKFLYNIKNKHIEAIVQASAYEMSHKWQPVTNVQSGPVQTIHKSPYQGGRRGRWVNYWIIYLHTYWL